MDVVSAASAQLFSWVQRAAFYEDLHRTAVELALATRTAPGAPSWTDVGCGPGLVARLAARAGADSCGIDVDPAMIRTARRHPEAGECRLRIGAASDLPAASTDIVSAASLLIGVADPAGVATSLWNAVRPGGALLVVETTTAMTIERARRIGRDLPAHDRRVLRLWARTRGGRSFDHHALDGIESERRTTTPVFHGLVEAIVITKPL